MPLLRRTAPRLLRALAALLLALLAGLPPLGPGPPPSALAPAAALAQTRADPADAAYNDLGRHEGKRGLNPRGSGEARGHTIARHVGLPDAALRERLARFPALRAASSFPDRATAQAAVNAALAAPRNAGRVRRWLSDARDSDPLALTHRFTAPVGRTAERGGGVRPARGVRVVLLKDGRGGYTILTAYPDD